MKKEFSQLLKHSGIYGIGLLASKAVGFFMIPVYTRYLVPSDYGILEMLDLTVFLAGVFIAMGIHSAVFRFYAFYEADEDKAKVISTALLYCTAVSAAVSLAMTALARPLAQALLGTSGLAPMVRLVAFTLFFSNLAEVPMAYWRAKQQTARYVTVNLGRMLLGVSLLVLFLVILHRGVIGVLYANLLTNAVVGMSLFAATIASVPRTLDRPKLKEMLHYGLPLVAQSLASFVLVFSDRFFLRHFSDLATVGVYSLGYKIASIVTVVVSVPFGLTWQWQQFELAQHEAAKQMYAKIQTYWLLISVFFGLGVSLLARDALRVMTPEPYWGAASIVPFIVLSYVLADVRSVIVSGVLVQRATHRLISVSVVVAASNLLLNYVLIQRYQAMGAAMATVLSYALSLALTFRVAQREYFVRYEYGRNAALLGTAATLYLLGTRFDLALLSSLLVNLMLLGTFAMLAFTMLDAEERALFRHLGQTMGQKLGAANPG